MKKIKQFLSKNLKTIAAFILGGIIFGGTTAVIAAVIASSQVNYDNTNSNSSATDVQAAIDDLYTKANTWIDPSYIDFTTIAASTNMLASKNGLCIKRNNKVSCFKTNNWSEEQNHIQQVFSDISCDVDSDSVSCNDSDYYCTVYSSGLVHCHNFSGHSRCDVGSAGFAKCSET